MTYKYGLYGPRIVRYRATQVEEIKAGWYKVTLGWSSAYTTDLIFDTFDEAYLFRRAWLKKEIERAKEERAKDMERHNSYIQDIVDSLVEFVDESLRNRSEWENEG